MFFYIFFFFLNELIVIRLLALIKQNFAVENIRIIGCHRCRFKTRSSVNGKQRRKGNISGMMPSSQNLSTDVSLSTLVFLRVLVKTQKQLGDIFIFTSYIGLQVNSDSFGLLTKMFSEISV